MEIGFEARLEAEIDQVFQSPYNRFVYYTPETSAEFAGKGCNTGGDCVSHNLRMREFLDREKRRVMDVIFTDKEGIPSHMAVQFLASGRWHYVDPGGGLEQWLRLPKGEGGGISMGYGYPYFPDKETGQMSPANFYVRSENQRVIALSATGTAYGGLFGYEWEGKTCSESADYDLYPEVYRHAFLEMSLKNLDRTVNNVRYQFADERFKLRMKGKQQKKVVTADPTTNTDFQEFSERLSFDPQELVDYFRRSAQEMLDNQTLIRD